MWCLCVETCKSLGLWAALSGLICFSVNHCGPVFSDFLARMGVVAFVTMGWVCFILLHGLQ